MAQRQIKMPLKDKRVPRKESSEEVPSPTKSDRTATLSAAGRQADQEYRSAAVQIKSGFPILQVSIYDGVSKSYTLVDSPARSSSRL